MAVSNPNLSYPKPRSLQTKIIPFARTDSGTVKAWLPKGAVVVGIHVYQATAAVTGASSVSVGFAGSATALVNAFALGTTSVGLTNPGTATGTGVFTPVDSDKAIIVTYGVGSSTAGGVGYVSLDYFLPGPGEAVDD